MSGFPQQVQTQPAIAVAGDFASANPRFAVIAGQGAFAAGSALYVGRFAWADPYTDSILNSYGVGPVTGFVGRNQQGLITQYLAESSMQVLVGTQCFAYSGGDFWVVNDGTTPAQLGMKAYANYLTGKVSFGPTGTPPTAASVTASIAAGAGSVTGSIAVVETTNFSEEGQLTVTAVGSGSVAVGSTITGTGIQTGTIVTGQISGTPNGVGVYSVNYPQTVASTTVTVAFGTMTVTAVGSGVLGVGQVLSGTNVTAGTYITAFGTGTGGTGTYIVSANTVVNSTTVAATSAVETKWYAASNGQAGELIAMSSHALG